MVQSVENLPRQTLIQNNKTRPFGYMVLGTIIRHYILYTGIKNGFKYILGNEWWAFSK